MSDTILGQISYIAKTGGMKLQDNDTWFNPVDSLKDKILQNKGSYLKKDVIFRMDSKGKVENIEVQGDSKPTVSSTTSSSAYNDHWNKKTELDVSREQRITVNEPVHVYKDLVIAVTQAAGLDLSDDSKIEKQVQTIKSIADELFIECWNQKVKTSVEKAQDEDVI